jgi:hypothetical protein
MLMAISVMRRITALKKLAIMGMAMLLCLNGCGKQSDDSIAVSDSVVEVVSTAEGNQTEDSDTKAAVDGISSVESSLEELHSETTDIAADESLDRGHQWLTDTIISRDAKLDMTTGEICDLPEVGLRDVIVEQKVEGHLAGNGEGSVFSAYMLGDYHYELDHIHDSYLVVKAEEQMLLYDFGEGWSYEDQLYAADIDGDGTDEVVVHRLMGMAGGAGSYASLVFKIAQGELLLLFHDNYYFDESAEASHFDTGFVGTCKEDRKLEISNVFTDMQVILDISNRYKDEPFDANGKCNFDNFSCDGSFFTFEPEDVDGDGIAEIVCEQYSCLRDHADGIGSAKTVLAYDTAEGEFQVIDAEFIPYS